jgi:23S rRNA (uracil1939-C5)-methyltransferase
VDACPLLDGRHKKLVKSVSGALGYLGGRGDLVIERVGIRVGLHTRDVEVALWGEPGGFPRSQVAKVLGDATHASSVVRVLTKGPRKARRVSGVEVLSGKGHWEERVADMRMALSAPSFFQVNTRGAERLVELVLDGLDLDAGDEVMDLYCGAGTFTLPLADRAGFVSAVEASGPAVRDLRRNLKLNRIDNVDVIGGDAGREFPDVDADAIVVDPPRAGLAAEVVERLSAQPARAIAYVSCDPATLARDLARFRELGTFEPVRVTPVDLFPQTYHVETVVLLSRI